MARTHHPGFDAMVPTGGSHPGFDATNDKQNAKSGIHLNPKHKGLLHEELHVPQGQPIPDSKIKGAEHSSNPAERKRAQFADNAKKFKHKK